MTVGIGCADDEMLEQASGPIEGADDSANAEEGGRLEPECGNGVKEQNEGCDDGNTIDDDECSNACKLPTCGDGIVQASVGEACDDGNTLPADGCTANCSLRGAVIVDYASKWFTEGHDIVVDSEENITVFAHAYELSWVAKFDEEFDILWAAAMLMLPEDPSALAVGPDDELLVSGKEKTHARTMRLHPDKGTALWMEGVDYIDSRFAAVAMAGDHMVSAGYYGAMFQEDGLIARHDRTDGKVHYQIEWNEGAFGPVAVDSAGWIWAIDVDKDPELRIYDSEDQLQQSIGLASGVYEDLAVDEQRNVYLLARTVDKQSFTLLKYDAEGTPAWQPRDYEGASASSLALSPDGTVIVAGHTSDHASGLLVWFDQNSGEILDEIATRGDGDDEYAVFSDVAVARSGAFAVVVGTRGSLDDTALWIHKVAL